MKITITPDHVARSLDILGSHRPQQRRRGNSETASAPDLTAPLRCLSCPLALAVGDVLGIPRGQGMASVTKGEVRIHLDAEHSFIAALPPLATRFVEAYDKLARGDFRRSSVLALAPLTFELEASAELLSAIAKRRAGR